MLPAAITGHDYEYQLMARGGFPPYTCGLRVQNADSTLSALPQWLQLDNNCVLRGQVPLFAGGTTMSISQPFTVSMCDRTGTCSVFELRLTTVGKAPQIVTETTTCFVNEPCRFGIATASGGVPPYYYRSDYLRHGAPPMGTIVDLNGDISGTPSRTGTYNVGVCVIDLIGAYSCDTATVIVIPREVRLYIYKSGDGSGKINVNPYSDGLVYPYGTVVTVSGRPDAGSTFVGWQGICEEAGTHDCSITMTGDRKVTAEFAGNEAPPPDECGTGHHLSDCGNGQTRCCMSNMECCRGDCRPVGWCD
jgi:hypothetical protein